LTFDQTLLDLPGRHDTPRRSPPRGWRPPATTREVVSANPLTASSQPSRSFPGIAALLLFRPSRTGPRGRPAPPFPDASFACPYPSLGSPSPLPSFIGRLACLLRFPLHVQPAGPETDPENG
jgi:hypothetical protein